MALSNVRCHDGELWGVMGLPCVVGLLCAMGCSAVGLWMLQDRCCSGTISASTGAH